MDLKKDCFSFSKPYTGLLILCPILSSYNFAGMSFGILSLLFIAVLIVLFGREIRMKYPKFIMFFFAYMIVTRVLYSDNLGVISLFSFSLISFGIIVGFNGGYFNLEYGRKIYRLVVVVCCFFFLVQEVQYLILGSRIVGLLNFLPLDLMIGESYGETISRLSYGPRSASLFTEPSHFSEFLMPLFAIELFNSKSQGRINFYVILMTVVFLLLQSGLGLILLGLLWIVWFFFHLKNSPLFFKLILIFAGIPFFAIGSYYYFRSEVGRNVFERTDEIGVVDATTSTYVRVFRGYSLYDEFPILNKVFGMNSSLRLNSIISKGDMRMLFLENDLSFNGIQSILIYGGIVGFVLFFVHFYYLFKMNGIEGRIIGVVFISLSLIAAIYLKHTMLLCYAIMYAYHQEYIERNKGCNRGLIR